MYLVHILRELVKLWETRKVCDLTEDDIEALTDSIPTETSLLIIPAHVSPETMNVVCSMLLASVLELLIKQNSFVNINSRRRFLLDVANALGFYCTAVSTVEKETATKQVEFIKLIYPKFALNISKQSYWEHPPIRFLHSIFSSFCPEDSPLNRGYKFQVLFAFLCSMKFL
jgi:hypothetical protein